LAFSNDLTIKPITTTLPPPWWWR